MFKYSLVSLAAYAWFDVAAEQGLDIAKQKRELIASRLTQADLKKAEAEANRYRKTYTAKAAQ